MSESKKICIVLHRRDLRLGDNSAVVSAIESGRLLIPIFVWNRQESEACDAGSASCWWLHHSLLELGNQYAKQGGELFFFREPTQSVIERLIREHDVEAVYWNRRYEPDAIKQDSGLKKSLKDAGIEVHSFNGSLLREPWEVETKQGDPYQVFTPFWKNVLASIDPDKPLSAPEAISFEKVRIESCKLDDFNLLPKLDWADSFHEYWTPGEQGAHESLSNFIRNGIDDYKGERDFPAKSGTSRMSPHLHFGEISPRQICHAVQVHLNRKRKDNGQPGADTYLSEIGWREFGYHILYHFPHTTEKSLKPKFDDFPWDNNAKDLKKWQQGMTGYPIVDAGMRELWETGWMHNRVRMIVGSFLAKDLLQNWKSGAEWFWDTLVDADLANNTLGWQWVAGSGADASPYFRVFNPVLQGERYDPSGKYIRQWIPELSELPDKWIHKPWEAPKDVLKDAGISLGETYPEPLVDHQEAREAALAIYEKIK
ncbi:Deoxyribodipyrimidine photo-lyase [Polystyrenella longa]|uniref:Deoxyribodipyrimidine photo-lyase n=1 Tax=Polystyrenella longa TaxID=2528007 RepID=A0A518CNL5_9PLAN|nr:deoxyribodipyrimidine photo-lyase [Polystyrenella longa]QDU80784.1 Deoxyribodipyrimidine photo-lyase [Polystyrenella longa]